MLMEMYRETAEELSQQMKDGTFNIEDHTFDMPLDLQRVWSDRLIGASANDYGRLLVIISNNERFTHLGAKGGSTAFILNDAMYAEDYNGNKLEIVLLTNDLNIWQQILLSHNLNSFESKLLGDEAYRQKVQKELS